MGGRGRMVIAVLMSAALMPAMQLAGCSSSTSRAPWMPLPYRADDEAAGSFVSSAWVDRLPTLLEALRPATPEHEAYRQLDSPELWRLAYAWDSDDAGDQVMTYRLEELSDDRQRSRRRCDLRIVWHRVQGRLLFASASLTPPASERVEKDPADSHRQDPIELSPPAAP